MRKTLFVVSAKPDAGLSNEILHLIREDEKQRIDGLTEENLRIIVMNEDQWNLHRNAARPETRVLFIGPVKTISQPSDAFRIRFHKYGIRYGFDGHRAFLTVNEKALKDHEIYDRFLEELKSLCSLEDIIQSPKRPDAMQLIGMLCVAMLVPFGSVLVGGKLIKDWYAHDTLVKKQQYVYGIFHLYRNHLKEFMDA